MMTIITTALIGSILILMVLYSIYIIKLRWYLEEKYPDDLEKLNFGKKISRLCYYTKPGQARNVMRFIFSDFDFDNQRIIELKTRLRIVIYLSGAWVIGFILTILFLPEIR